MRILEFILNLSWLSYKIINKVVCSAAELLDQIEADILQNGRLGCQRLIPPQPQETEMGSKLRAKAQWRNDCGFKAQDQTAIKDGFIQNQYWVKDVDKWASITKDESTQPEAGTDENNQSSGNTCKCEDPSKPTGELPPCTNTSFYNINQEKVVKPYNKLVQQMWNQADMCLIIRSLLAAGKMPGICADAASCAARFSCNGQEECHQKFPTPVPEEKLTSAADIIKQLFEFVKCPGPQGSTKVCALNGDSQDNPSAWLITLNPLQIKLNGDEGGVEFKQGDAYR